MKRLKARKLISVILHEEDWHLLDAIDEIAIREKTSRSAVILKAIEEYVNARRRRKREAEEG